MTALARTGPNICGPTEPMFIVPRSLARSAGSGSTAVIRAWSTDMDPPYPAPSPQQGAGEGGAREGRVHRHQDPGGALEARGDRDEYPPATQPVREQAAEHRGPQRAHEVDHHERQQARPR